MKRLVIAILLLSLLLMTGCAQSETPPIVESIPVASQADVPEPAPEPEWQPGVARIDGIGVFFRNLARGEAVSITGEEGSFYVVSTDDCETAYVEKRFLRTEADEPFLQSKTVYAARGARLYTGSKLVGAYDTLAVNTQLEVIDELHGIAMVKLDGNIGFVSTEQVQGSRYSTGGGGGGSADGGDISLACIGSPMLRRFGILLMTADGTASPTYPCTGTAFADDTELYILVTQAEQELKVTEYDDGSCTVYTGEKLGTVPRWAVILGETERYERWTGYAKSGAKAYDNLAMEGEGDKLTVNSEVDVIYETDGGLYIVIHKEKIAFVPADGISKNKTAVNNGGNGGGEWTPPAL